MSDRDREGAERGLAVFNADGDRGDGDVCVGDSDLQHHALGGGDGPILVKDEVAERVGDGSVADGFYWFDDVRVSADNEICAGVGKDCGGVDLGGGRLDLILVAPVRHDDDEVAGGFFRFDSGGDCLGLFEKGVKADESDFETVLLDVGDVQLAGDGVAKGGEAEGFEGGTSVGCDLWAEVVTVVVGEG